MARCRCRHLVATAHKKDNGRARCGRDKCRAESNVKSASAADAVRVVSLSLSWRLLAPRPFFVGVFVPPVMNAGRTATGLGWTDRRTETGHKMCILCSATKARAGKRFSQPRACLLAHLFTVRRAGKRACGVLAWGRASRRSRRWWDYSLNCIWVGFDRSSFNLVLPPPLLGATNVSSVFVPQPSRVQV